MQNENIKKLLILQERDSRRQELEDQIDSIPREIESIRARIKAEEANVEESRETLRKLDAKKNALEGEVAALEQHVLRYRNQQLQVKKNEEYQALTHQIEAEQEKIAAAEDEEIALLFEIDDEKKRASELAAGFGEKIGHYEKQIEDLMEREAECRSALPAAVESVAEAREGISPDFLREYDHLLKSSTRLPVVVPLRGQNCGGCHLRVSRGIDVDVRGAVEISTCDNCGRILY
ncbi:MAG: C4-type zinc ribbon domain-containing protein [Opitutales bacterium]